MNIKLSKPYGALPVIYDHLMGHVKYDVWVKYIRLVIKDYVKKDARVLELAAGNCIFAKKFKQYFPNIIVSDISFDMLSYYDDHSLPKVCCSMINLPFKTNFDLVYSTFDSINYLTSPDKLLRLFKEVAGLLNDTGIFTFDVSLEKNSLLHSMKPVKKGIYNDILYTHKSEYDKETRLHKNTFHLHVDEDTVYKEVHVQRIYPFETYFEIISRSGLYVVDAFDAFSFNDGRKDSRRIQFLLKKVVRK